MPRRNTSHCDRLVPNKQSVVNASRNPITLLPSKNGSATRRRQKTFSPFGQVPANAIVKRGGHHVSKLHSCMREPTKTKPKCGERWSFFLSTGQCHGRQLAYSKGRQDTATSATGHGMCNSRKAVCQGQAARNAGAGCGSARLWPLMGHGSIAFLANGQATLPPPWPC